MVIRFPVVGWWMRERNPLGQTPIGPYEIERRLALGGMAEVFVAQRQGPHGFSKRVALKRILPQFAGDPDFVSMFIDEAKLAARLQHPNVVQVFDFGEHGGELFLAMELVSGTNVNKLVRTSTLKQLPIPLDVALYIVAQTAAALRYAHHLTDDQGEPLGFVHRDVSPANILLTDTGHVKLTDFGIAMVRQRNPRTEDGHVRGKLGYMSPEQVMGKPMSDRSDVFTLGSVFAEMLMGRPLFGTGKELDVLVRIRDADIGALHKAEVPRDVVKILEACLNRAPEQRPSARELGEVCDEVRRRRGMSHGPERLVRLLKKVGLVEGGVSERPSRPAAFVDTSVLSAEAARLVDGVGATSPAIYWVRQEDSEVGPMSYPKLVELITAGTVDRETFVRKEGGAFEPAFALPELTRFVTSVALQWQALEIEGAERTGTLQGIQLVGPLFEIMRDRRKGVLHLWEGERRKKIYFVDGKAEFVASTDRRELLGEHLVASGRCLRMEIEMALALLPRYGGRIGEALVGLGMLRPVELFRAINEQVRERVLEAFRWRSGRWAFVADVESHEETFPIGGTRFTLLRDAVARAHPDELEAALAKDWEKAIRLVETPPVAAREFEMPRSWIEGLAQVEGGTTAGALLSRAVTSGADLFDVYRALFLGMRTGLVA